MFLRDNKLELNLQLILLVKVWHLVRISLIHLAVDRVVRLDVARRAGIDKGDASCIFYEIHVGIKIVDIHLSVVLGTVPCWW